MDRNSLLQSTFEKASVQSKIQGRGCPITFFSKPESMFKG